MVYLPLTLWTHVWISLHANQKLHPKQGGLTNKSSQLYLSNTLYMFDIQRK